jgi:nucleotide-binding universal stress UspA family protein
MAFPYKRILCPVDFDSSSIQAVEEARALARSGDGKLYLLHVIQINPLATEGFVLAELIESQEKYAREQLEQITGEGMAGVECEIVIERGNPADVILTLEKTLASDLVVMATHGRRGLTRLVLGSVTERVVRESITPVLTVRPMPADKATPSLPPLGTAG